MSRDASRVALSSAAWRNSTRPFSMRKNMSSMKSGPAMANSTAAAPSPCRTNRLSARRIIPFVRPGLPMVTSAEITERFLPLGRATCHRRARNTAARLEEIADRHVDRLGDLGETAGRHPTVAALVLMHLLRRDADIVGLSL